MSLFSARQLRLPLQINNCSIIILSKPSKELIRSFRTSSMNSMINHNQDNFILNAKLEGNLLTFEKKEEVLQRIMDIKLKNINTKIFQY